MIFGQDGPRLALSTTAPPPPQASRYASLDLWRGLACLMIALNHSIYMIEHGDPSAYPEFWTSIVGTIYGVISMGHTRVPVFFVISGFCIATLCDKLRRGPRPARTFLARRFRRIYPTFWVYLLLSMLIVPLVRPLGWMDGAEALTFRFFDFSSLSPWRWFGNVTLTGNWSESFGLGPGLFFGPDERAALFFGHLWTLTVEVQFYLICGLVLLLAPRRFFAAIAVLTAVFLARMGAHLILPDRNWMCFAVGCLLYCQLVYFSPRLRGWTTAAFLVCGVVVLAAQEMGVGLAPRLPVSPTSLLFAALLGVLRPFDRSLGAGARAPDASGADLVQRLSVAHAHMLAGSRRAGAVRRGRGGYGAADQAAVHGGGLDIGRLGLPLGGRESIRERGGGGAGAGSRRGGVLAGVGVGVGGLSSGRRGRVPCSRGFQERADRGRVGGQSSRGVMIDPRRIGQEAIDLAPCASWLGRSQTAVDSVQEGQAAGVVQEVADLRPVGPGQALQGRGDLRFRGKAVVEPAVGAEQVQRGVGTASRRFEPLHGLERPDRVGRPQKRPRRGRVFAREGHTPGRGPSGPHRRGGPRPGPSARTSNGREPRPRAGGHQGSPRTAAGSRPWRRRSSPADAEWPCHSGRALRPRV
jgi:peptidoglycan/LPS O-acetylase OafA/YrhL